MAQETQYFDFSAGADPFAAIETQALAVLMPARSGQLRIDIFKDIVTVGRTDAADVVIAHKNVSKNHAEMTHHGGQWTVRDTASTNGVFVNGNRISETVSLNNGDRVSFGDQEYIFTLPGDQQAAAPPAHDASGHADAAAAAEAPTEMGAPPGGGGMTGMFQDLFGPGGPPAAAAAPPPPPPPPPSHRDQASSSPATVQRPAASAPPAGATMMASFDLSMTVPTETYARLVEKSLNPKDLDLQNVRNRFGSAKTNDLIIADPSVKPEHGEIIFEEDGRIRVRTLDNEVFVRVNGEPIRNQFIKHLDSLQIGDCVFTFQLFKVPDPAAFSSGAEKPKGGLGKFMLVGLMLIVLATAVGIFLLPQVIGESGEAGAGGGPTPAPTVAPTKSDFDAAESLFLKQKYAEAMTLMPALNAQDPEVQALDLAIRMAIRGTDAMKDKDYRGAIESLERLQNGPYENSQPIQRLRDSLAFERKTKARESFEFGQREFDAGRFDKSAEQFRLAEFYEPGYPAAIPMAEAARLAGIGQNAVERATELARQAFHPTGDVALYTEAAKVLRDALDAFQASTDPRAVDTASKKFAQILQDLYNYNLMMASYVAGNSEESLLYYSRLSEAFVDEHRLMPRAERIKRVGALMAEAAAEQSLAKAEAVKAEETDPRNAYHRQARDLSAKLSVAAREQAERWLQLARQQDREEKHSEALESAFKARQIDPRHTEAENFHATVASRLLTAAYRLGENRPEDRLAKIEAYKRVMNFCFPDDTAYRQAEIQVKRLQ